MPSVPGPHAQMWMNATAGILTVMTRRVPRHDCLGGAPKNPESTATTQTILKNSWGIESREKLLSTLTWLRDEGHRAERDPNADDGLDPRGLLAWDLVRLNAVAGWGYVADFITEEEAYGFIAPSAKKLQKAYTSWTDLGDGYVKGTYNWSEEAGPGAEHITKGLLSAPTSPWKTIPWGMDLDMKTPAWAGNEAARSEMMAERRQASQGMYYGAMALGAVAVLGLAGYVIHSVMGATKDALHEAKAALHDTPSRATPDAPEPAAPPKKSASAWDGKTPFTCGGSTDATFDGITASFDSDVAITAGGNCHLVLKNVKLKGTSAVVANGNAHIEIQDSVLTGAPSVAANGNAQVTLASTKLNGAAKKAGNGKISGL